MNKMTTTFENRVRFNWGYHDGASHRHAGGSKDRNGVGTKMDRTHFDQVYVAGFQYGYEDSAAGSYDHSVHGTTLSDGAWERSGLKNGNSLKPHKLMGRDQSGRKIAPWMR